MYRSRLGRLVAGRVVAVVAVSSTCALGTAACGGSSSSSSTASVSGSSSAAAAFAPVLLRLDVQGPAYSSSLYGGQTDPTAERSTIAKLRATVYQTDLAVRKLKPPASAQQALVAYLTDSGKLVTTLDHLYEAPSMQAVQSGINSSLTPVITKFLNAETALRTHLGLPKDDPWLRAQPLGPTIYSDSLSGPHGEIKWLMGPNVHPGSRGLEVSAAAQRNGLTGPSTPYTFDSRHIAVQVDEKTLKGDPYVGIMCAPMTNAPDSHAIGQIGPGANWSIGVLRLNQPGYLMVGLTPTKTVKTGQTNHLRVDCDEWRPGLTTVRLYVNGQFVGASSGAFSVTPQNEAGVAIVSPKTDSLVTFTNWTVSRLTH